MSIEKVIQAINNLDLKQISLENVEILQKMIPTEQEIKAYKEYIADRKDPNLLTEEDKFMMQLTKVERIASKLAIMNYMGNFFDSLHLISPVRFTIIVCVKYHLFFVFLLIKILLSASLLLTDLRNKLIHFHVHF